MSCRRCKRNVQKLVLGLCIACSILSGHGGDDDVSLYYAVGRISPPAAVAVSTGNLTIQLTGVSATTAVGLVSVSTS